MKRCGWPEENIAQWAALHVFGLAFAHDLILVSEMGDQLRRVKNLVDKELPLADANVLFAMEGPKAKKDAADNLINPARKPWQVIYHFLQQFGNGSRIFSIMDGLASVGQAALSLGSHCFREGQSNVERSKCCLGGSHCWFRKLTQSLCHQNFTCC